MYLHVLVVARVVPTRCCECVPRSSHRQISQRQWTKEGETFVNGRNGQSPGANKGMVTVTDGEVKPYYSSLPSYPSEKT